MVKNKEELKYIEENEIDLKELFFTILKHKYKILIFVFFVTCLSFVYVLSIPNSYKSEVILSPQSESKSLNGGLSSLASLAGVSIGGNSSKDPAIMMKTVLNDYSFNEYVVKKYNLGDNLEKNENFVFAFGIDSVYKLFNSKKDNLNENKYDLFSTIATLKNILSISSDKKSGLIILKAESKDRILAKKLVDIYLKEIINKIKNRDIKEIEQQIKYYNKELSNTYDVYLKEQLSKSLSALYQKKVFSQANDFYFVSKVVDSRIPNIQEKTKPKRSSILIMSFVTSFILSIFLIFFIEFFRNDKKD